MNKKIKCMLIGMALTFAGCTSNGPNSALDKLASALESNNSSAFLGQIDMNAYAANKLKDYAKNDSALSSLNAIGQMLGLGNIDSLIGNIIDLKGKLTQQFEKGVASGEIVAECRTGNTTECPWVPSSLREAHIVKIGENAAIAKITTPTQLTSWLALQKRGEKWLVVGQSVMENQARAFATANYQDASQSQNGDGGKTTNRAPTKKSVEM